MLGSTLKEVADKLTVSADVTKTYVYRSNENVSLDTHQPCAMLRQGGWSYPSSLNRWTSCSHPTAWLRVKPVGLNGYRYSHGIALSFETHHTATA